VVVLGVVFTLTLWLAAPGLFGLSDVSTETRQLTATVTAGSGCAAGGGDERVTFTMDGREHQAKLDGCGHREGEPVDVSVPSTPGSDMVVHAASAATGESDARRPVAFILFLLSSFAGGAFAFVYFYLTKPTAAPAELAVTPPRAE
ncbi:MAG: hypothetical protein ABW215_14740, partial [Kibdelosporangium sp.]